MALRKTRGRGKTSKIGSSAAKFLNLILIILNMEKVQRLNGSGSNYIRLKI
jgi:hypothetical protein